MNSPKNEERLREEILEDARRQAARLLERARREGEKIKEEIRKKEESYKKQICEEAHQEGMLKAKMILATLQQEKLSAQIRTREKILNEVIQESLQSIQKLSRSIWQKALFQFIQEAILELKEKRIILYIRPEDRELLPQEVLLDMFKLEKIEIRTDAEMGMGVYITREDGKKFYNNLLQDRLNRNLQELKWFLLQILQGKDSYPSSKIQNGRNSERDFAI